MTCVEKISQDVKARVLEGVKSRLRLVCGCHSNRMVVRVAYQAYLDGLRDSGYIFDLEYITLQDFGISHTGEMSLEEKEEYIDNLFRKRME